MQPMNDGSAEQAAHMLAQAVIDGDLATSFGAMTPDALAKAMAIGNTTWNCTAYELTPQGQDDDAYIFDITYQMDQTPMSLRQRLRQVDGAWKIVDLERIG